VYIENPYMNSSLLLLKNKQVTMIIERRKIQANNAYENLWLATNPLSWAASIMWSLK
jgi:hypothetical protein